MNGKNEAPFMFSNSSADGPSGKMSTVLLRFTEVSVRKCAALDPILKYVVIICIKDHEHVHPQSEFHSVRHLLNENELYRKEIKARQICIYMHIGGTDSYCMEELMFLL